MKYKILPKKINGDGIGSGPKPDSASPQWTEGLTDPNIYEEI